MRQRFSISHCGLVHERKNEYYQLYLYTPYQWKKTSPLFMGRMASEKTLRNVTSKLLIHAIKQTIDMVIL